MFRLQQLTLPIIQAPMAGGINTPGFASAVANAGGVGSFEFAYSTPQQIRHDLMACACLTKGPINANFFVFSPVATPSEQTQSAAIKAIQGLAVEGEYSVAVPQSPYYPDLDAQLESVWECKPAMLTFHFGIPPAEVIDRAHALGILIGITATNLDEAMAIERAGADFIVAQGIEAGGHRGAFDPTAADFELKAEALTRLIVSQCSIPVLMAGAIMNGKDIRQALDAGAIAAQLGTAFLCCDEAGTSPAHKAYLLKQQNRRAVFTAGFSGRMARGIENRFIEYMADQPTLPFPLQNTMTASLRQWASKTNNGEYQSLWAGEAFAQVRQMPVCDLMQALRDELLGTSQ